MSKKNDNHPPIEATLSPAEVLALRQDLDAERELCMAVMRVSAEKDCEIESLRRNRNAWRVVAIAAILGHLLLLAVAAKIVGWM